MQLRIILHQHVAYNSKSIISFRCWLKRKLWWHG